MKRKLILLTAILLLLCCLAFSAHAAVDRLADDADLLSASEQAALRQRLDALSAKYSVDVVIVTTDSIGYRTPRAYADDYYDSHGYRTDGVLLLISMEDQDWWISTSGYGIRAFTDAGLGYIEDRIVPLLSSGDYAEAFDRFAELCDSFLAQAQTGEPYDSHNLPKDPFQPITSLLIALAVGVVVAFIATAGMKSQLKSVRSKAQADDYVTPGSFQLTHSRDIYLYSHLSRREKPQSNGGSSTHRSSSGVSHGGRGGKF